MTIFNEPRNRRPITRSYDLAPPGPTKLYRCQSEEKNLALALGAYSEACQAATAYTSDIDEGVLIMRIPGAMVSPVRGGRARRRSRPRRSRRLHLVSSIIKKRAALRRGGGPNIPKSPAIIQVYKGAVESIRGGLAYLSLESIDGQRLQIEWDAAELARLGVGERLPFILKTITVGNRMEHEFTPDELRPLSAELRSEIDALREHYRKTGQFDDDDE